jgi:hypothetical protein
MGTVFSVRRWNIETAKSKPEYSTETKLTPPGPEKLRMSEYHGQKNATITRITKTSMSGLGWCG